MQEKDRKFKQVKEKKEKYKQFYIDTCEELQSVRQQSEIYWKQIQEIKNIAIFDIERLKQEVVPSGKQKNSSDCKSYSSEIYTSDGFINVSHERVKTSEN